MRTVGLVLLLGSGAGFLGKMLLNWNGKIQRMLLWNHALEELQSELLHTQKPMPYHLKDVLCGELEETGMRLFECFMSREYSTGEAVWRNCIISERKLLPKRYYEKLYELGFYLFSWRKKEIVNGLEEIRQELKEIAGEEKMHQKKESALYAKVGIMFGVLVWIILA